MNFRFVFLIACVSVACNVEGQDESRVTYIERYKDIAIREMERAGIPASIKLAQGILESNAGKSYLAKKANNHFGIKCGPNWKGKKVYRKDDDYNNAGKLIESCFRSYKSVEASFIAHSEFLRDPLKYKRYGHLFELEVTDYEGWARGLKKSGYATSATYHEKLIVIIESYRLYQYDTETTIDPQTSRDYMADILMNNDVKYVMADDDETVAAIAKRTDVTLRRLLRYNEQLHEGGQALAGGTVVYIQPKRKSYRGKKSWHYVKEGETMFKLSQRYAINLGKLYKRNLLSVGQEPAVGERIKLKGGKVKTIPKIADPNADSLDEDEPIATGSQEATTGEIEFEEEEVLSIEPQNEEQEDAILDEIVPVIPNKEKETEAKSTEEDPGPDLVEKGPEKVIPKEQEQEAANIEEEGFDSTPMDLQEDKSTIEGKVYHTVVEGDTLWNISVRYNTTVDQLKKMNSLLTNSIQKGTKLRVK